MPSRIVREGINSSARMNALSMGAELLYRRLMSVVDDYGRYYASPAAIRGACWPTHPSPPCEQDVDKWLTECMQSVPTCSRPLITLYEVAGCWYIQLSDFNQKVRSKSKFPTFVDTLHTDCGQVADKVRALDVLRISNCVMRNAAGEQSAAAIESTSSEDIGAFSPPPELQLKNIPKANGNGKHDRAAMDRQLKLHEWAKNALLTYPGAQVLHGSPDDVVIGKCLAISRGHPGFSEEQAMGAALVAMSRAGKEPAKSWMWFPSVMPQFLEAS